MRAGGARGLRGGARRREGDDAFAVRFERFFTELRDPLVALYGDDPRFARGVASGCWGRSRRTAAERPRELRMLDHEREVTPDWLQREQAVGYVTYVDRFAGTLTGVRERLPYLRELGVTYLHLMPLLAARPAPNDGGYAVVDYGAVEPSLGTMDDLRALAADLRASGMALCVDLVLNHVAAEHPWARDPAFLRHVPGPYGARRLRAHAAGRLPGHGAGVVHAGPTSTASLGLDDVQRLPVGPRLHEPRRVRGDGRGDARAGRGRRRRAAPGRRAVPVEAARHQLPEPARGPRAAAGLPRRDADRGARGRLQGRGDRRAARPRPLPRDRQARGQGVRPRLPQRAHGPALERAGVGARGADDLARCARCRPSRPARAG